jgi:hypothetical protein
MTWKRVNGSGGPVEAVALLDQGYFPSDGSLSPEVLLVTRSVEVELDILEVGGRGG